MPESTHTQLSRVPMKRLAAPDEIADTIVFIASSKASYITGASIAVAAGKLSR
jgi:NAD(P)-dependent dehydrogenase (short-subunit alcohol dehydrogenase family)